MVFVLNAATTITPSSSSTSRQRSERISPCLIPGSRAHMRIGRRWRRRASPQASSSRASSSRVRMRSRFFSSAILTSGSPIANGLWAIHPSRCATLNMRLSKASSRLTVAIERLTRISGRYLALLLQRFLVKLQCFIVARHISARRRVQALGTEADEVGIAHRSQGPVAEISARGIQLSCESAQTP